MTAPSVDVSACKAGLDKFAADLLNGTWEALGKAVASAETAAKQSIQSSTKRRTGTLLGSFHRFRIPTGGSMQLSAMLSNTAPHARYIDEGTKPHTIRARNAQYLRFTVGGQTLYRRVVNHPGTKPRPFTNIAGAVGLQVLSDGMKIAASKSADAFNR